MSDAIVDRPLVPFPVTLDEIDRDWLTTALRTRAPGVVVRDFEMHEMIRGTRTKARLRLEMDEAGRHAGIPETVLLKGGFEEHSRALNFVLRTETSGYRDLLTAGALNAPTCYFSDFDEQRRQGIIIMEDLRNRRAVFGDPMKPRSHADIGPDGRLACRIPFPNVGLFSLRSGRSVGVDRNRSALLSPRYAELS